MAQQRSGQLYNNATSGYDFLNPQLTQEAANPQGYTPQQLSYMNTASQQSLGGGAAATTGTANLEAARTRNAGGFQGAVGTANRGAQKQLSQNALGIEEKQANLQEAQRQSALSALQSLYGTNLSGSENYLGASNTALNAENQAPNFWQKYLTTMTDDAAKVAAAGAGA